MNKPSSILFSFILLLISGCTWGNASLFQANITQNNQEFLIYDSSKSKSNGPIKNIDYKLGSVLSLGVKIPESFKNNKQDLSVILQEPDNEYFYLIDGDEGVYWNKSQNSLVSQNFDQDYYFLGNFKFDKAEYKEGSTIKIFVGNINSVLTLKVKK